MPLSETPIHEPPYPETIIEYEEVDSSKTIVALRSLVAEGVHRRIFTEQEATELVRWLDCH